MVAAWDVTEKVNTFQPRHKETIAFNMQVDPHSMAALTEFPFCRATYAMTIISHTTVPTIGL
jgi:hypothetical protein